MRWRGRRESSNVSDQRGRGGGFPGMNRGIPVRLPIGRGGGGISTIIIIAVLFIGARALGIDPMEILTGSPTSTTTTSRTERTAANDEAMQFASVVLAETEDVWNGVFQAAGVQYQEPRMVVFSGQVQSACGFASAASGPFYCPGDKQVYIDLDFFDELANRFGASGDFAQAYVIAHEVGHHVQNLTGVLPKFNQARQRMNQADANAMSVRVELQADCYAGVWANHTDQKGLLEAGDLDEALNAAFQIGDDTLQKRSQGYVVPESFNHGTSAQRKRWFLKGYQSGDEDSCDTFSGNI